MTEAGPDKGEIRDGAHHWNVRVHYADTDAAGVVYYANYLVFAERARAEAMRCLGADLGGLKSEGFQFVVLK